MSVQYEAAAAVHAGAPRGSQSDARWGLGVALIVFGSAVLGLRFVPQVSWIAIWPLFFIVVGVVQMVTPGHRDGWSAHRLAEGVGTVLFGVALLGCTTGYVAWSMWLTLLSLWPLLLVVAGLRVLGRATGQVWLAALATLLVWGALLFSAAGSWTGVPAFAPLSIQSVRTFVETPEATVAALSDSIVDATVGTLVPENR